jgi:hypothetical protein
MMLYTVKLNIIQIIRELFLEKEVNPKEVCLRDAEVLEIAAGQIRQAIEDDGE